MDLMERERKDPNWRDRELKELAKPLRIETDMEEEMLMASFKMECQEILDAHSSEYNEGFIAGLDRHIDMNAEFGEIRKKFASGLHNIYSASQITQEGKGLHNK